MIIRHVSRVNENSPTVKLFDDAIPEAVKELLRRYYMNFQFNFGTTDALNGYGCRESTFVKFSLYHEHCYRCGYSTLFNKLDMDKYCKEHHNNHTHRWERGYADVFFWSPVSHFTIEQAVEDWKNNNSDFFDKPIPGNLRVGYYME